jgi:ABC-2 type transport system ATP-binding protein
MREILVEVVTTQNCTVFISSHILGELEKIATHYGIIRRGKLVQEISAKEMESRARVFVSLKVKDMSGAKKVLKERFAVVKEEEYLRVYDEENVESIVECLLKNGHAISEISKNKIGLEEYYVQLMSEKESE